MSHSRLPKKVYVERRGACIEDKRDGVSLLIRCDVSVTGP